MYPFGATSLPESLLLLFPFDETRGFSLRVNRPALGLALPPRTCGETLDGGTSCGIGWFGSTFDSSFALFVADDRRLMGLGCVVALGIFGAGADSATTIPVAGFRDNLTAEEGGGGVDDSGRITVFDGVAT